MIIPAEVVLPSRKKKLVAPVRTSLLNHRESPSGSRICTFAADAPEAECPAVVQVCPLTFTPNSLPKYEVPKVVSTAVAPLEAKAMEIF
jgi:hypothetical protein